MSTNSSTSTFTTTASSTTNFTSTMSTTNATSSSSVTTNSTRSTTSATNSGSSSSTIFNSTSSTSISTTSSSESTSSQQSDPNTSSKSTDTSSSSSSQTTSTTSSGNFSSTSTSQSTSQVTNSSQTTSRSSSSSTLTVPTITVFQTTIVSSSGGSQITSVVQVTSTIAAGSVVPVVQLQNTNNSRVRAIAGGTVGGVVGLALLALLAFLYLRHQRQKRIEREFDGNFDPTATDRRSSHMNSIRGPATGGGGGTLPNVSTDEELLDDGMGGRLAGTVVGGGVISPFVLPPPSQVSMTSTNDPRRIIEYDRVSGRPISPQSTGSSSANPYISPLTTYDDYRHRRSISGNSKTPPSSFSYPTVNVYGNVPRSTSPSSASEYSQSQGSSKEREARTGFIVANQDNPNPFAGGVTREQMNTYLREGPSPRTAHFPHHQAVEQNNGAEEMSEIPPTYDSLMRQ